MLNTIFRTCVKNPKNIRFDGEDHDEHVLYLLRRSFITNLGWIALAILMFAAPFVLGPLLSQMLFGGENPFPVQFGITLFLAWMLVSAGFVYQNFVLWYFNVYLITNKRIMDVDFKGLLYKNISESPLRNIEDVTSNVSGTLRVIFNFGDVLIQTAGETPEFEFEDVDDPSSVRDILSDLVTSRKSRGY